MSLEAAVLRLQDRVEILEALYAYCRHADCQNAEGMVSAFTEDCEVSYHPDGSMTSYGKADLLESRRASLSNTACGSHHVSNVEVIWEGRDCAVTYAYLYSWQRFKEFPLRADCHRWGRYECRFVRLTDGWRISRMNLLSAGEYGGARIGEIFERPFPPRWG